MPIASYSAIFLDAVYICAYNVSVNYQWDKEKAKANLLKHGVSFADAVTVFSDDAALTIEDDEPDEQKICDNRYGHRWTAFGGGIYLARPEHKGDNRP
jgi:glycogen synthase